MSQANKAIQAMDEVVFDISPNFDREINAIYKALNALKEYERQASARSWEGAVDRQGGSFSQEEIDQREGW